MSGRRLPHRRLRPQTANRKCETQSKDQRPHSIPPQSRIQQDEIGEACAAWRFKTPTSRRTIAGGLRPDEASDAAIRPAREPDEPASEDVCRRARSHARGRKMQWLRHSPRALSPGLRPPSDRRKVRSLKEPRYMFPCRHCIASRRWRQSLTPSQKPLAGSWRPWSRRFQSRRAGRSWCRSRNGPVQRLALNRQSISQAGPAGYCQCRCP
jgi:hypothetical protein